MSCSELERLVEQAEAATQHPQLVQRSLGCAEDGFLCYSARHWHRPGRQCLRKPTQIRWQPAPGHRRGLSTRRQRGAIYLRLCKRLVKGDGARSVYLHTSECHQASTTAKA